MTFKRVKSGQVQGSPNIKYDNCQGNYATISRGASKDLVPCKADLVRRGDHYNWYTGANQLILMGLPLKVSAKFQGSQHFAVYVVIHMAGRGSWQCCPARNPLLPGTIIKSQLHLLSNSHSLSQHDIVSSGLKDMWDDSSGAFAQWSWCMVWQWLHCKMLVCSELLELTVLATMNQKALWTLNLCELPTSPSWIVFYAAFDSWRKLNVTYN
jgi:hypothetical protein